MIDNLLLSNEFEASTDEILLYLNHYKCNFNRKHETDIIEELTIQLNNDVKNIDLIYSNETAISINNNSKLFYRRGDFSFRQKFPFSKNITKDLYKYLNDEWAFVKRYLHTNLASLGSYYLEVNNNRLINLERAKNVGLLIPNTLVTTSKKELKSFFYHNKKVITKPIHNAHTALEDEEKIYKPTGVVLISDELIEACSDSFSLSLFQNYINKKIEIRVFFLGEELYPMAIFSQNDQKTAIDYRNYNNQRPNRNVPFCLPQDVKQKILAFIKISELDTGSIDLIYTPDKNYYFLEVNPVGQFGWVSKNCNYYIEKKIALKLIS